MEPSKADIASVQAQLASARETLRTTLSHLNMMERNVQRAYKELMGYKGLGEHAAGVLDKHVGCADWEDLEEN